MRTSALDWLCFFRPGTSVVALPNWKRPRLLLPAEDPPNVEKLISQFFRVHTIQGKMYRAIATFLFRTGRIPFNKSPQGKWALESFVTGFQQDVANIVLVVGRPAPIQKVKIVLLNAHNEPVAYIKYGERELARRRLFHEYEILRHLPGELGPSPLNFGELLNGTALMLAPVLGDTVEEYETTPSKDVLAFQGSLTIEKGKALEDHPWIKEVIKTNFPFKEWLEPLAKRKWDVVIQHGDFVPWNLLRIGDGRIVAVDWEFASLRGFPYLDLVYYILQTSALIRKQRPRRAFLLARDFLMNIFPFKKEEADSLVRLAAFYAYYITKENGRDDSWFLQRWRRVVWETRG